MGFPLAAARRRLLDPNLSPDDKLWIEEKLREADRLFESNPLQAFEPHVKQVPFLDSNDRLKAFLGGNRSGKTTCGIIDNLIQAVDADCLPANLRRFKKWTPPFKCRIVAPDFIETMQTVIFEKLRQWTPRDQLHGGAWDKAYSKVERKLNFKNGSQFSFMTFEQDLDKFGGAALHRVHFDEEPPEDIRKECQARLMDYAGDELFTMTPLNGMTWMYDGVFERRYEDGVTVIEVATDENPHVNKAAMEEFFASLTPEEVEARRKGRFVHFGGLVLSAWRDDLHLVEEIRPDQLKGQDVLVGIDPGIARGGVVFTAVDRDNSMLVFDELYPSNQTIKQIAEDIKEKLKYWGLKTDDVTFVIDPSGRNRTLTGEQGPTDEFTREGIYCVPGENSRRTGIFQLRRRLAADPPALRCTRNCRWWLWERGRWRVAEDEESTQDKKAKGDTSTDSFKTIGPDHLQDPTRYIAMYRAWGPLLREGPKPAFQGYQPGVAPSLKDLESMYVPPSHPLGTMA